MSTHTQGGGGGGDMTRSKNLKPSHQKILYPLWGNSVCTFSMAFAHTPCMAAGWSLSSEWHCRGAQCSNSSPESDKRGRGGRGEKMTGKSQEKEVRRGERWEERDGKEGGGEKGGRIGGKERKKQGEGREEGEEEHQSKGKG